MKRSAKEWGIRIGILLIGLVIAHFGVTLFLLSDLGSDPFNVFIQGIFRSLDGLTHWSVLTHGRVHMAVSLLIILILLFAERSYIKIGTALCMFFGGPIIDFFTGLLEGPFASAPYAVRIVMLIAGCVILAFGMTVVIRSDAGTGPNDLVALVISEKSGRKFSIIRIVVDVSFALLGWVLGGTLGLGTLICMFLVGPVAGVFLPVNERLVNNIIRRFC